MIVDTIQTLKHLQDPETIATSLLALRDELFVRIPADGYSHEFLYKVNSCLYSTYPVRT